MSGRAAIPGNEQKSTPRMRDVWRPAGPVVAGVLLGSTATTAWVWLTLAAAAISMLVVRALRQKRTPGETEALMRWAGVIAALLLIAAYASLRLHHVPRQTVEAFLTTDGQLVEVAGVVEDTPRIRTPDAGFFADFSHERPITMWTLRLDTRYQTDGSAAPLAGRVLVKANEVVTHVEAGQRVRILGWLADVGPTKNPGEFDFRSWLAQRGVVGRVTVTAREHIQIIETNTATSTLSPRQPSAALIRACGRSLSAGLETEPQRLALLETLLLGRATDASLGDLRDTFRRVGLAHVLSISGAHLGILIGLVWLVARAISGHPQRVPIAVLIFVLAYTALLPGRVPIIRATIMATALFLPLALGRHVPAIRSLAVAAVVVLLWRPGELFAPGFQLSFGAVGAIMLFTRRVSEWLWPQPLVPLRNPGLAVLAGRFVVDYFAVSLVAFGAVLPIIVFHFGLVSPLAVLLSMLAWPVLGAVLALGYLKMLVGLLLPSAGLLLSGPLAWAADALINLAQLADTWPGSSLALSQPVSLAWTAAAMLCGWALLAGRFGSHRRWLAVCITALIVWLTVEQGVITRRFRTPPPLQVTMFAVGDGSSFLVRSADQTLLFDCGSQGYPQVGQRSVVPALRRLGVNRLDVLVLSHADLDHFSGVPEVIESVPVGRILVSPEVLTDAKARPDGATAFLLAWLETQRLPIEPVTAGWSERFGDAKLTALWPPPGLDAERSNDHSLVLRIEAAGRAALLNGDLQADGTAALLDPQHPHHAELNADLTDLPHHGSFTEHSPAWLAAVSPEYVFQSSGPDRLRFDDWAETLKQTQTTRFVSDRAGMTTVTFTRDGEIVTETYINPTPLNPTP